MKHDNEAAADDEEAHVNDNSEQHRQGGVYDVIIDMRNRISGQVDYRSSAGQTSAVTMGGWGGRGGVGVR